ncbi:MAG: sigma-70 family RNA polymerase sigma factor [Planctomycetes bacterium]|nr:sigma-70 family RNA polymerase sigma factor [Planctomycetota bacterium]
MRSHHAAVYRSALRITRADADAQDVTQKVFLALLEGRIELAPAAEPGRVLRWWAVRMALAHRRGATRGRRHEEASAMERPEHREDRSVETNEERRVLQRLVDALPEELRVAVELRFREQWTLAEVGAALELSEPGVHERLRRALERLRHDLVRLGFGAFAANLELELARDPAVVIPAGLAEGLLARVSAQSGAAAWPAFAVGAAVLVTIAMVAFVLATATPESPTVGAAEVRSERADAAAVAVDGRAALADTTTDARVPASTRIASPTPHAAATEPALEAAAETRARILGSVVDELGAPVGGVRVLAAPSGKGFPWLEESGTATTRPDGAFELDVVLKSARGTLEVAVGGDTHVLRERPVVRVSAGETVRLAALVVERVATDPPGEFVLALRVVDPAGAPLAGLPTRLFRRGKNAFGNVGEVWEAGGLTGPDGTIELAGTTLGTKLVVLDARDQGWRLARERVTIAAPGRTEHVLRAERGGVIAGRLVDLVGAPAAGITLWARPASDRADILAQVDSGADGRFELVGLDPELVRVHVDGGGFSPAEFELEPSRTDVLVQLKLSTDARDVGDHMAELHGRIVGAAGGAPVLVSFDAVDVVRVESATRAEFLAREAAGLLVERPVQTMVSGDWSPPPPASEFHRTGLGAGRWVVVARVAGFAPSFAGPFELGARTVRADVELALAPLVHVTGRVLDARGAPVAGALVVLGHANETELAERDREVLRTEGQPRFWYDAHRTDAEGRFRADATTGIGLRLHAFHARFLPTASAVHTVGDAGLEVELHLGAPR